MERARHIRRAGFQVNMGARSHHFSAQESAAKQTYTRCPCSFKARGKSIVFAFYNILIGPAHMSLQVVPLHHNFLFGTFLQSPCFYSNYMLLYHCHALPLALKLFYMAKRHPMCISWLPVLLGWATIKMHEGYRRIVLEKARTNNCLSNTWTYLDRLGLHSTSAQT